MKRTIARAAAAGVFVVASATGADAQERELSDLSIGIGFLNTQPLGELRTGPGFGVGLVASWALDPAQHVRIRGDFRAASYGMEDRTACLSQTVGCWIEVDIRTSYNTLYAGIGPELVLPVLGTELVLSATAGVGYFGARSSLHGVDDTEADFGSTSHFDDAFFAWTAGGDLHVPVSRVVAIRLGTHYQHNGTASYVLEGGITENPDGSLNVAPVTGEANMLAVTLGVSVRPPLDPKRRR